jgi:hypothetical protein
VECDTWCADLDCNDILETVSASERLCEEWHQNTTYSFWIDSAGTSWVVSAPARRTTRSSRKANDEAWPMWYRRTARAYAAAKLGRT